MKLSAFEKVIRKVVREEIDYALRREIALLKENLTTNNQTINEVRNKPAPEELDKNSESNLPHKHFHKIVH